MCIPEQHTVQPSPLANPGPYRAYLPDTTALSVWMSKVQRSSTSLEATLVMTSTTFCSAPPSSQSAVQPNRGGGGVKGGSKGGEACCGRY